MSIYTAANNGDGNCLNCRLPEDDHPLTRCECCGHKICEYDKSKPATTDQYTARDKDDQRSWEYCSRECYRQACDDAADARELRDESRRML